MRTTYYAERLADERELMTAVKDAMEALDTERLNAAAKRINNTALLVCAAKVAALQPVGEMMSLLEQLCWSLASRIAYLKPLAQREKELELAMQEHQYRQSL